MKTKRVFASLGSICLILILVALSWVAAFANPAPTQKVTWRLPTVFAANTFWVEHQLTPFVNKVREFSDGGFEIKIYPGNELGISTKAVLRYIRDNRIDIGEFNTPHLAGELPFLGLAFLPHIANDRDEAKVIQEAHWPVVKREVRKQFNGMMLSLIQWGRVFVWANKRVVAPADYKGLKIRTYTWTHNDLFKKLGAAPVGMSLGEVYGALQRGVLDATTTGADTAKMTHLDETCKYINDSGLGEYGWVSVVVNIDSYNKLPKQYQNALMKATEWLDQNALEITLKFEDKTLDYLIGKGMELVPVPVQYKDQLWEASKPVIDIWLKKSGPLGDEAYREAMKALKAYRAKK